MIEKSALTKPAIAFIAYCRVGPNRKNAMKKGAKAVRKAMRRNTSTTKNVK